MAPTPDMAVKSWLHGVSFDIIRSTNRLQQCYHDDPLLRIPSNFIYTCVPNTNAPYLKNLRQQWCYHTRYGGREITSLGPPQRIIGTPRRVLHLLHDYWHLQSGSIIVYTCIPNTNASCLKNWGHHGVTIHGMSIESWPPGPPQVITRTPRRVLHLHHNDGDLRSAPNVVYTYIPNTNAPHLKNWDYDGVLLTLLLRREDLLTVSSNQIECSYISYQCLHLNPSLYVIDINE